MINYIVGLIGLIIATYQDIKSREIDDYIWIMLSIFGLLYTLTISILYHQYIFFIQSIIGFTVCFFLGYILFLFGVGAADGKILAGLGALVPKYNFPVYSVIGYLLNLSPYIPSFPIVVFINSLFFCIFIPIVIFIKNILNKNYPKNLKEFFYLFIAEKMKYKKAKNSFRVIYGKEKINILKSVEEKNDKYNDEDIVWTSPEIPFIVPMLLSYILTPYIGDYIVYKITLMIFQVF
ncbi:prepilin peptidase [Methanocaldococcus indicus]|uniref:prepilin peptidase n=1 Tax=Methanocaldococcus indicus TaxID=213231 RepID=UPI003C6D5C0E